MTAQFVVVGDKALRAQLNSLPGRVETKIIGKALRSAARPIVTAMRRNALALGRGKETSAAKRLRRAAKKARLGETMTQVSRTYRGTRIVVVGPAYTGHGMKGRVGHLVEEGHEIVLPKSGPWRRILKRVAGRRVKGRHFAKAAWDANKDHSMKILMDRLWVGLEMELRSPTPTTKR